MAVTGFYSLEPPEKDAIGWFLATWQTGVGYLLNHTPHIGDVGRYPTKQFYFDLESSAHAHAAGFYMNHGHSYPYQDLWQAAYNRESAQQTNNVIESQIMEFIE